MSSVTYSIPFFILYTNSLTHTSPADMTPIVYCLEAGGAVAGQDIVLQTYDGNNLNQMWVYGSDQRIYLYNSISQNAPLCIDTNGNSTANNASLVLSAVNDQQLQTQQWNPYSSTSPSTYITLLNNSSIVIDNENGTMSPGNKVQIYQVITQWTDVNQIWSAWTSPPAWT